MINQLYDVFFKILSYVQPHRTAFIIKDWEDDLNEIKSSHKKCFQEVVDEINNLRSIMDEEKLLFDEDAFNFYVWYIYNNSPRCYINIVKQMNRHKQEWYKN